MDSQSTATQPFAIRVISLTDSPRRAIFAERAKTSVAWDFFDAHTSNQTGLKYDSRKAQMLFGRELTRGEIGCYSSHYALWKFAADSGKPVIIFEDDVDPDWSFMEQLANDYAPYAKIDFLRFWELFPSERVTVGKILGRDIIELLGYPRGMQGYLVTPGHGRRLVQGIRILARPIDDEIDRVWLYGAPNLLVDPPPLAVRDEPSEIGDRDSQFGWTSLSRIAPKIVERIQKELYIARRKLQHSLFKPRLG